MMVRTKYPSNCKNKKRLTRSKSNKNKHKVKHSFLLDNTFAAGNPGGGRPSSFRPEYAVQTYKLCLLGATDEDLASFFGVSEQTINTWKKEHDEFSLSLMEGKELADANVAKRFYNRAMGYTHPEEKVFLYKGEPVRVETEKHYPPDTQAGMFWLVNRQPNRWKNKNAMELTGKDGGPIKTENRPDLSKLTDEELNQLEQLFSRASSESQPE